MRGCPPRVVIDVRPGDVFGCFPVSGQCYNSRYCFAIPADHPDFAATGLTKSCFVHFQSIVELKKSAFGKPRGRLTGSLLTEFREEAGV